MNIWTRKSMKVANQQDYLDQLYKVYPMAKNIKRVPEKNVINNIEKYLSEDANSELIRYLLSQKDLPFPIKDSYVSFLRRDKSAIDRNPKTVNRLSGMINELGIDNIKRNMSKPIETNRQIGPLFKEWVSKGSLGVHVTDDEYDFMNYKDDVIFNGDDDLMKNIAKKYLGYGRDKGLDFLGKFNNTFIIGEAKFLTDFGGHQNDQMEDALSTLRTELAKTKFKVLKIAILDGVVYLENKGKMQRMINKAANDEVIISSLFLRDYIYTI